MTKKALVVVSLLVAVSVYGVAQKNEISFVVGGTFSPDGTAFLKESGVICVVGMPNCATVRDTASINTKIGIEGVYGRRIIGSKLASFYLELPVLSVPSREVHPAPLFTGTTLFPPSLLPFSPRDFSSIFVTPSVKIKLFPAAAVAPFVSAGGGFAHYSSTTQLFISGAAVSSRTSNTTGAFQVGGGVDIKTPLPHVGLRGEVREFWTGRPDFTSGTSLNHHHNLFAGGGIVFHF